MNFYKWTVSSFTGVVRVATPAGVGRVGVAGVGVWAPGIGALPNGCFYALPAGCTTVFHNGLTCPSLVQVYDRPALHKGEIRQDRRSMIRLNHFANEPSIS